MKFEIDMWNYSISDEQDLYIEKNKLDKLNLNVYVMYFFISKIYSN